MQSSVIEHHDSVCVEREALEGEDGVVVLHDDVRGAALVREHAAYIHDDAGAWANSVAQQRLLQHETLSGRGKDDPLRNLRTNLYAWTILLLYLLLRICSSKYEPIPEPVPPAME